MWSLVTPKGRRFPIRGLPAVVGSGEGADVRLPHESIADPHARLHPGGGTGLRVEVLGEGVVALDGQRVDGGTLGAGEEIILGRLRFRLEQEGGDDAGGRARSAQGRGSARSGDAPLAAGRAAPRSESGAAGRKPGRTSPATGRPAASRKETRRGLLHADLSQLAPGAKLVVTVGVLAICGLVLWGVQALVVSLL
jgi:hypothetical protein